jgi:hypothetical protein
VIVTGPEGGGKSTLLRQIAVQAASGIHPFRLEPSTAARVLLVDVENSRRQVKRQLRPLRLAAGEAYHPPSLRIVIRPDGLDLLQQADAGKLEQLVIETEAELLVIGPIYKLASGDPTAEDTARRVTGVLDRLRDIYDLAVIIEAHSPYASGGQARPKRPYGASLWSRWPEFGLHLAPDGRLEHWRGQRDERAWPAKLERSEPWPWAPAEGQAEGQTADWKPTALMERASRALELENAAGNFPTRNALARETKGKRAFVLQAIAHLIDDGNIHPDQTGKRLISRTPYREETAE